MSTDPTDAPRGFVRMADHLALQRRCDLLETELAEYREQERDTLTDERIWLVRDKCHLTHQQARVLLVLLHARVPMKPGAIMDRVSPDARVHTAATIISYANTRARRHGLPQLMHSLSGRQSGGYTLTPEGRAWLEANIPELFTRKEAAR